MNTSSRALRGLSAALVVSLVLMLSPQLSGPVLAQEADTVPEAPDLFPAVVTEEGIALEWNQVDGSTETEYVLYRRVLPHEKLSQYATVPKSGSSTSFIDTNVEPGLRYLYRVTGVNSAGEGPKSNPFKIVVPGETLEPPSDLAGTYTEQGMELTWGAPTNAGITDYQVYRGIFGDDGENLDGGLSKYVKIPADSDPMAYLDTGVEAGEKYRYRIRGVNALGEGSFSIWLDIWATIPEAGTVPAKPEPTATSTEQGIRLTWSAPPGPAVTEYLVYRGIFQDNGEDLDGVVSEYDRIPADSDPMAYLDTDVEAGEKYRYRIRGFNAAGEGAISTWLDIAINSPATGAPTISGRLIGGEMLRADTSGISDEDGMSRASFTYEWIIGTGDDARIDGYWRENRYLLHPAVDVGHTVQVRVTFTDDRGFEETRTSEPTAAVGPGNNVATGQPTISGSPLVRYQLTADISGIADADGLDGADFSYQWLRDGSSIAGATESRYTLSDDDEGSTIEVRVTFVDDRGFVETRRSEPTPAVEHLNNRARGAPTISGTAQVGETLEADTSGISDADGMSDADFAYSWFRSDEGAFLPSFIEAATESTYTLVDDDEGKFILVRVSFFDDRGNEERPFSEPTPAVAPAPNHQATGAPTISGLVMVGEMLTADSSGIADADGLETAVFRYQWLSSDGATDTAIAGAASSTYTPVEADEGTTIRAQVSFTDDRGFAETRTSGPTAAVGPPNNRATGAPAITGKARVGRILSVDASGIADADGLNGADFSYQWLRNGEPIEGATGSSYEPTAEDAHQVLRVRVSFADGRGVGETLTSEPTAAVLPANRPATGAPVLLGTPAVGQTLTVDTSAVADEDGMSGAVLKYEWYRGAYVAQIDEYSFNPIEGATGSSHTLTEEDLGLQIQVRVKFRDDGRTGEKRFSEWTERVIWPNLAAVGQPTISGTLTVGATLTADVSEIADADGLDRAEFSYQWLRDGEPIDGASDVSYTLTEADEGHGISVRVTFIDDRLFAETSTSPALQWPNRPAVSKPTISGTAEVGEELTADVSGIADADGRQGAVFSYQWLRDGEPIEGASGVSYVLVEADEGRTISVRVSFVDDRGFEESRASYPTAAVLWPNSRAVGVPVVLGEAQVGETLEADVSGIADADGLESAVFSYQWLRDGEPIEGASAVSYVLVAADEGRAISVQVGFVDDRGFEESRASDSTAAVLWPNRAAVGQPAISGSAEVGETLEADVSGIADADGLDSAVFSYQWLRDGEPIEGASGVSYVLVAADEGRAISVQVGFVDDRGFAEARASDATAAVLWPNRAAVGQPTISGSAEVGETLEADVSGIADADGLGGAVFSFQWLRDGEPIEGASAVSYVLVAADEGRAISVRVGFVDDRGFEESRASDSTAAVLWPNRAAVGQPAISGSAEVGETLEADVSGIADADGLEGAVFSYQWLRDGEPIEGASGVSYALVAADEGRAISVQVGFVDDRGFAESRASDATAAVLWPNSRAVGQPTISGTAEVGEELTADVSGIADADGLESAVFSFQWLRDGEPIEGASAVSYVLAEADEGHGISVRVSFVDDRGFAESRASDATAAVLWPNSRAVGQPTISGTAEVGEELTADVSGIADADGLEGAVFSFQWLRDGEPIEGASSVSYVLAEADEGHGISVRVSFVDDRGFAESRASDATAAVLWPNSRAVGQPTISGTAEVGEELTADVSGIADADGLESAVFSFQWLRDGEPIEGASAVSYVLVAADDGAAVSVRVSFVDGRGFAESRASDSTAAVLWPNSRASGVPLVLGTAQVGEELTADVSGIADADGLQSAVFSFQWLRDGEPIEGASSVSYVLVAADDGAAVSVRVSFVDGRGFAESRASDSTAAVLWPNRAAVGQPTISGTAEVGETLEADVSGIADADGLEGAVFSFQWLRDGEPIEGASGVSYVLVAADDGAAVSVRVSFVDGRGFEESRASDSTAAVLWPNSQASGVPLVLGTAQVGEELTADVSGIADADGLESAVFSFQWLRDGEPIEGASGASYVLVAADDGAAVSVRVSFVDDRGFAEARTSDSTAAVLWPNRRAVGVPVVLGTAQVGEELTADVSGIADADGLESVVFSFQWLRDGEPIEGASGASYVLVAADDGAAVSVRVSFVDGRGFAESRASDSTAAVLWPNSQAVGVPVVLGAAQVGEELTADVSGIADADGLQSVVFSYQWLRDGEPIEGASSVSYVLVAADDGAAVSVRVSFVDDRGFAESRASDSTAAVLWPNRAAVGQPTISGTAEVGETLEADVSGIADADGLESAVVSFQWLRDGEPIEGASGASYVLVAADDGAAVSVRVSFVDDRGFAEARTSDSTAAVLWPNRRAVGVPVVLGTAQVGEELTADVSGIADADGLESVVFSFQWLRDGEPIEGASGASYVLVAADDGAAVSVRVSFVDGRGFEESRASDSTAAVVWPNRAAVGQPTISGTAEVGETLEADVSGIADADGLEGAVFGYQWLRDGEPIAGASDARYTLAEADEGHGISVRVSFVDGRGFAEARTSDSTAAVLWPNRPVGGQIMIIRIGTYPAVGGKLTASTFQIKDEDGIENAEFSYQWLRNGSPIDGATSASYKSVADDDGQGISVRVSFTDDHGHPESLTSQPVTPKRIHVRLPIWSESLTVGLHGDVSGYSQINGMGEVTSKQFPEDGQTYTVQVIAERDGVLYLALDDKFPNNFDLIIGLNERKADRIFASTDASILTTEHSYIYSWETGSLGWSEGDLVPVLLTTPIDSLTETALVASFRDAPQAHNGSDSFTFAVGFSEEFELSYKTLRDHAFTVEGGTVTRARRARQGSNIEWEIHVQPDGSGDMTIVLPLATDCDAEGAICTEDGRLLSNRLELAVAGPEG